MNDSPYNDLREAGWRRKLTPEEEARLLAWLAGHPEAQAEWEEETALTDHLRQLPDVPLSSNFTARVLQAVDVEMARQARTPATVWGRFGWLRGLAPRFASVGLLLVLGLAGFFQYQASGRAQMVRNVALVSSLVTSPGPEVFQDFDAIQQLPVVSDDDLLAALR